MLKSRNNVYSLLNIWVWLDCNTNYDLKVNDLKYKKNVDRPTQTVQ